MQASFGKSLNQKPFGKHGRSHIGSWFQESRKMDDDLADGLIATLSQFEDWDAWHDFKFAEKAGLNPRFFLPAIEIALRSPKLTQLHTPEDRELVLELLRERARAECGLKPCPGAADPTAWQRFPNPDFPRLVSHSFRGPGEALSFNEAEIRAASDHVSNEFPDIAEALRKVAEHNHEKDPHFRRDGTADVQGVSWLLEPLKHAVLELDPALHAVDNQHLAIHIYDQLTAQTLGDLK